MKKPAFTYSQIRGVIRAVKIVVLAIVGAVAFFAFWWALWIFQPVLGVPM